MQNRPLTRLHLPPDTCERFQKYLQEKETQCQRQRLQQQIDSKEMNVAMGTATGASDNTATSVTTRRMTRRSVVETRPEVEDESIS